MIPLGILASASGGLGELYLVATATSTSTNSVTTPSSVQIGDLLVYTRMAIAAESGSIPTEVTPTGFTLIAQSTMNAPTDDEGPSRFGTYYKIATSSGAQTITGSYSLYGMCAVSIYRPLDGVIKSATVSQAQSVSTNGNPSALSLTGSSIVEPSIILYQAVTDGTESPTTLTPSGTSSSYAFNQTGGDNTNYRLREYYKTYATGETTENGSFDFGDTGLRTCMTVCYVSIE